MSGQQGTCSHGDSGNASAAGNDAEVDIMTMEDEPYFSSDEEEEQRHQLHYLPVTIHKAARPADKYASPS